MVVVEMKEQRRFHSLGVTQGRRQAWLLGNLAGLWGAALFAGRLNYSTPLGLCNILVDPLLSEGIETHYHSPHWKSEAEACAGETAWSRS